MKKIIIITSNCSRTINCDDYYSHKNVLNITLDASKAYEIDEAAKILIADIDFVAQLKALGFEKVTH